eukprot:TRINITY_DN759_c0_g1_i1.p1 TRINITY_DN759_c0_g1~~TRINITY_DN759_c0_g1_i1.p1  ORF type:complete len:243 (-),score=56.26 TRINITY_DN759_c0_g1_i1:167-895(-)
MTLSHALIFCLLAVAFTNEAVNTHDNFSPLPTPQKSELPPQVAAMLKNPTEKIQQAIRAFASKAGIKLVEDSFTCFDPVITMRIFSFSWSIFQVATGLNPAKIAGFIIGWKEFKTSIRVSKETALCVSKSQDFKLFMARFGIHDQDEGHFFRRLGQRAAGHLREVMDTFKRIRSSMEKGDFSQAGSEGAEALDMLLKEDVRKSGHQKLILIERQIITFRNIFCSCCRFCELWRFIVNDFVLR